MNSTRRECLRLGLAAGAAVLAPIPTLATEARKPLQIGLWGCNPRGLALGVSALRCTADVELRVIADPDPASAKRAANWWRHPAHRPSLRERIRIDEEAVLSGSAAASALACLPLDALLLADPGIAPPADLMGGNACVLPSAVRPNLLSWLLQASARAEADGHVLSVCAAPSTRTHACAGADLRAQVLAGFFGAIRQGRRGDADGRIAALLAANRTGLV